MRLVADRVDGARGGSVSRLLERMQASAFQGRRLGEAFDAWKAMIDGQSLVCLGLAGSLASAGLSPLVAWLVERGYVDLVASTSANATEDLLEQRGVPFFVQVDEAEQSFGIVREVPERLTFTADMDEAARERATKLWEKARKHIHEDYADIRKLDWALGRLLAQLQRIRGAVERTREEQFRLARQLAEIAQGDDPPFELPFQVSRASYEEIVLLLVERLEDDRERLERVASAIVAVGLTARSTDARSHSLADNLRKVLCAVVADAEASEPRGRGGEGDGEASGGPHPVGGYGPG
jgi:hypothetical protein